MSIPWCRFVGKWSSLFQLPLVRKLRKDRRPFKKVVLDFSRPICRNTWVSVQQFTVPPKPFWLAEASISYWSNQKLWRLIRSQNFDTMLWYTMRTWHWIWSEIIFKNRFLICMICQNTSQLTFQCCATDLHTIYSTFFCKPWVLFAVLPTVKCRIFLRFMNSLYTLYWVHAPLLAWNWAAFFEYFYCWCNFSLFLHVLILWFFMVLYSFYFWDTAEIQYIANISLLRSSFSIWNII